MHAPENLEKLFHILVQNFTTDKRYQSNSSC